MNLFASSFRVSRRHNETQLFRSVVHQSQPDTLPADQRDPCLFDVGCWMLDVRCPLFDVQCSMFTLIYKWASFVKVSHTVFSLPFALASMLVAARDERGWPGWRIFGL